MRFNRTVAFWDAGPSYDPVTGGVKGTAAKLGECLANVTETGTTRTMELFGSLAQRTLVVRLRGQVPPTGWAYLTLDDDTKHYILQTGRDITPRFTLLVGEST